DEAIAAIGQCEGCAATVVYGAARSPPIASAIGTPEGAGDRLGFHAAALSAMTGHRDLLGARKSMARWIARGVGRVCARLRVVLLWGWFSWFLRGAPWPGRLSRSGGGLSGPVKALLISAFPCRRSSQAPA